MPVNDNMNDFLKLYSKSRQEDVLQYEQIIDDRYIRRKDTFVSSYTRLSRGLMSQRSLRRPNSMNTNALFPMTPIMLQSPKFRNQMSRP